MDRFFEKDSDILKKEKSDYDLSSARFLGREISRVASSSTKMKLIKILEREASAPQGHGIALNVYGQNSIKKEPYERLLHYFNALLSGILDQR